LVEVANLEAAGREMHALIAELFPICRSITGEGLRRTLRSIERHVPITVHEVPSGTRAFDWTVPEEWNISDAWVKNGRGERVIDFRVSNLHVVNYSVPTRCTLPLAALQTHLFSLPEHPDWVPYRTAYYERGWGFCVSERQRRALEEGTYEVVVDSTLGPGNLSYGEWLLPGSTREEVLISCHVCHPSLANDNLSGIALTTFLAKILKERTLRFSYRFLFVPGTIGSLVWLSRNEEVVGRIRHGLVAACVGDSGPMTYKKSRRGDAGIDRAATHALRHCGREYRVRDFSPYGYDERQYCSPGFNLPVGSLTRTPHGSYPEYHTSADDLDFVRPEALADSLRTYLAVLYILEGDRRWVSTNPKGEPQLGRRGLYRAIGGLPDPGRQQFAMLWVLNLADGSHTLLDIAERSGLPFAVIEEATRLLFDHGLLAPAASEGEPRASSGPDAGPERGLG
jgi:aminopeptidase-like protein